MVRRLGREVTRVWYWWDDHMRLLGVITAGSWVVVALCLWAR
jgi:hypothetical protein